MELTKKQIKEYHKILDNLLIEYNKIHILDGIEYLTLKSVTTDDDEITKKIDITAVISPTKDDLIVEDIVGKKQIYLIKRKLKDEYIELNEDRFNGLRNRCNEKELN